MIGNSRISNFPAYPRQIDQRDYPQLIVEFKLKAGKYFVKKEAEGNFGVRSNFGDEHMEDKRMKAHTQQYKGP